MHSLRSTRPRAALTLLLVSLATTGNAAMAADGIYTDAQATRGARVYSTECASCHGATLRGAEAAGALLGTTFVGNWTKKSIGGLYEYIRTTMPPTRPAGLPAKSYVDVLAYLLRENGMPAGTELPADTAVLAALAFVPGSKPAAAPAAAATLTTNTYTQWPYYGGDAASTRYSPLEIINRDNVADLQIVWRWKADNFGPRPEFNYRTTPLMVNGVLYATAGLRRAVAAIDGETGETLWTYRLDEGERGEHAPRVNSGRGVAYWSAGGAGRILYITPGFHLIALDAQTGLPVSGFGRDGIVDLKKGLDRELDPVRAPVGSSSPPIVVGDIIVVGSALPGGFAPTGAQQPPGHVRGFDIHTGEQRWIFHTIPHPGEFGYQTWEPDAWQTIGNAAVWTTLSADLDLGYVYLPLESATADHYGGHRPGDNLFSQSLVCLDAKTGKRVWHFQTVHHGIWDYDLPAAPILFDALIDGERTPLVAQLTKQAFVFIFDRRNGKPRWPIEERAVPQTDVPTERTAATQPFPTKPAPFDRQGVTTEDFINFTPELRAQAIEAAAPYRTGPLFTPPSLIEDGGTQGTLMLPGQGGGANWPGGAVDPETAMLYVGSSTFLGVMGLGTDPEVSSLRYIIPGNPMLDIGPHGLPLIKPPWGRITAIDLTNGEHVWQVANGEAEPGIKAAADKLGIDLPRAGRADRAGLLVTKSLLFAGEGAGMYATLHAGGPMFRAHDKATGEIVSEFELPGHQSGLPMTYAINDRQFIVVAVGAPGHPGELIALSIP